MESWKEKKLPLEICIIKLFISGCSWLRPLSLIYLPNPMNPVHGPWGKSKASSVLVPHQGSFCTGAMIHPMLSVQIDVQRHTYAQSFSKVYHLKPHKIKKRKNSVFYSNCNLFFRDIELMGLWNTEEFTIFCKTSLNWFTNSHLLPGWAQSLFLRNSEKENRKIISKKHQRHNKREKLKMLQKT